MNSWSLVCLLLGVVFFVQGIVFFVLGEKGAMLISGFNTLSECERRLYDQKRMSKDMCKSTFLWCFICFLGGTLAYFFSRIFGVAALIILAFLFFREVHFDAEKAFKKYRKVTTEEGNLAGKAS